MAPSANNSNGVFAVVILLLVIMAAGDGIHAESASAGDDDHLSGNYEGVCVGLNNDDDCGHVCVDESSDNVGGHYLLLQCWCQSRCTTETVAAASAPTRQ
ncbi:hypothetical protein PVAP13_4NG163200 [Panicum virgatum]|uniref:Knottin scorpion toxin-like domain-containing protein n=1 Tax=Panicum virgatum TaxID=38727 RepID=A0A8T0T959_PANVG|nr:hypothetical protein PVAP13_4NG163200 [Panicum virgatum]